MESENNKVKLINVIESWIFIIVGKIGCNMNSMVVKMLVIQMSMILLI